MAPPLHFTLPSRIVIFAAAVIGLGLSFANYQRAISQDRANISRDFERQADLRHNLTRETLERCTDAIFNLGTFLSVNPEISRRDFTLVGNQFILRNPSLDTFSWLPEVQAKDRARFEKAASDDLKRPFTFLDRSPSGATVPSAQREVYNPIYYHAPGNDNDGTLGFDAARTLSRISLAEARNSRNMAFTNLVQLPGRPNSYVMLITYPVFSLETGTVDEKTPPRLLGYVRGAFQANKFFQALRGKADSALDFILIDPTTNKILTFSSPEVEKPNATLEYYKQGLHSVQTLTAGNRSWLVIYLPKKGWIEQQTTEHSLLQLLGGFCITALLTGMIYSSIHRRILTEQLVMKRTSELTASQANLDSILNTLPAVMFRYKWDDRLTMVNVSDSIQKLSGYPASDFIEGRLALSDLILPEDLKSTLPEKIRALKAGETYETEFRLHTRDGGERWVLSRGRGVVNDDGMPVLVEGLAIDITARKAVEDSNRDLERKMLEGQKLESLGLLASGVAHDFNNLITGILGNIFIVRAKIPDHPDALHRLQQVEEAAHRAAELCRLMLDYTGKTPATLSPVNAASVIRDLLPLLRHSLRGNSQLLFNDLPGAPLAKANATQLRQVVMNLVLNAADAVDPKNGAITVSISRANVSRDELKKAVTGAHVATGDYLAIEVDDNGCGISPQNLFKIFDPFFTTKVSGRGLGLASTLGIIRNHRGALFVDTTLGAGTRFKILLPLADNSA